MPTRGNSKSIEFKQAVLATASTPVGEQATPPPPALDSGTGLKPAGVPQPTTTATTKTASPVAIAAAKGTPASPRFTAEETILLRGLASGASSKEMAAQMRLPRESLYRLIGDLRRKTGATSDTALAVWVLRNMGAGGSERRGGGR
jgi:DNA-binding CsgD family transcriptional regulator